MKNQSVVWVLEKINKGLMYVDGGNLYHCDGREVNTIDSYGYKVGSIRNKGSKKQYKVHRVLFAYYKGMDALDECEVINHKDFDRTNNKESNLEGISSKENVEYSKLKGRYAGKLTEKDVLEIKRELLNKVPCAKIGEKYGVVGTTISAIKYGYSWRHIE